MVRWLASRKVGTKLMLIVTVLAVVAAGVGILGIARLASVNDSGQRIYTEALEPTQKLGVAQAQFVSTRLTNLGYQTAPDAAARATVRKAAEAEATALETAVQEFAAADGGQHAAQVKEIQGLVDQYNQIIVADYFPAVDSGDPALAQQVRNEKIGPLSTSIRETFESVTADQHEYAEHVRDEATAAAESARNLIIIFLVIGLTLGVLLAVVVTRQITRPLNRVREVAEALATGDLTRTVDATSTDEVGEVGRALDRAMVNLSEVVTGLDGNSRRLADSSASLAGTADQLTAKAEEGSAQAGTVSAASEEVSRNIDTVAAGSEEMSASIREIAASAAEAAKVSLNAVDLARDTTVTVEKLGASSTEIGHVVKVITSIAGQTNLLALNATIEAARAGEAGKGFAVVASEVKDLAQETAKATEDIASRVEQIQRDTGGAVGAIGEIASVIATINDHATGIAAAVEEQSATTTEMSRNVTEAATGAGQITENVTGVAVVAQATLDGAAETQQASRGLSEMSDELRGLVGRFRV